MLEREVLFFLDTEGRWMPYKTRYLTTRTYALLPHAGSRFLLLDPDNQAALAVYCENWAIALQKEWFSELDSEEDPFDPPALWLEPTDEEPVEETFVDWLDDEEDEATYEC